MFFPGPPSDDELEGEALEAAQLLPCRCCRQLTPQQVLQVIENLPRAVTLARVHCQACQNGQLVLLTH
jgi:hypothetical protein